MIPAHLVEQLSTALARWEGRGPTEDDTFYAGEELATAAMAVLLPAVGVAIYAIEDYRTFQR